MNALWRLMYGPGLLPDREREQLAGEDVSLLVEGLSGSLYAHVRRAPGVWHKWVFRGATGAVGISSQRLVVSANRMTWLNVAHRHPDRRRVEVRLIGENRVEFTCQLALIQPDWDGIGRVRLRTGRARQIVRLAQASA